MSGRAFGARPDVVRIPPIGAIYLRPFSAKRCPIVVCLSSSSFGRVAHSRAISILERHCVDRVSQTFDCIDPRLQNERDAVSGLKYADGGMDAIVALMTSSRTDCSDVTIR